MQFQSIAQIRQKATVEALRDKILSMSLCMVFQIVDLVQQQATAVTVKSEIFSMVFCFAKGILLCHFQDVSSYEA